MDQAKPTSRLPCQACKACWQHGLVCKLPVPSEFTDTNKEEYLKALHAKLLANPTTHNKKTEAKKRKQLDNSNLKKRKQIALLRQPHDFNVIEVKVGEKISTFFSFRNQKS